MGNCVGVPAQVQSRTSPSSSSQSLSDDPTQPETLGPPLHPFNYNVLKEATRNFQRSNILGEGGFGSVFKGYIDERTYQPSKPEHGIAIAVKRLNSAGTQGHNEWLAEVNFLGQFRHPNLVKLIGHCADDDHRLLVYEFMSRGSLDYHLFSRATLGRYVLSWVDRMKIAVGAARGLAFLHDSARKIIYRDLKAANILLDSQFNVKLSDFGFAKDGPTGDNTHVSTKVVGTLGYAAPEYVATGHLTLKSDVYSFGVVLLEILTGRPVIDQKLGAESNLVELSRPCFDDFRRLMYIIDPKLAGEWPREGARVVAAVAKECLCLNAKLRPTMNEVLQKLMPLALNMSEDV